MLPLSLLNQIFGQKCFRRRQTNGVPTEFRSDAATLRTAPSVRCDPPKVNTDGDTAPIHLGWPRRIGTPSELRRFDADGSIFGRKSDLIAKVKINIFENSIHFNQIKQYANLIKLK